MFCKTVVTGFEQLSQTFWISCCFQAAADSGCAAAGSLCALCGLILWQTIKQKPCHTDPVPFSRFSFRFSDIFRPVFIRFPNTLIP